jgi:16S rRNA (guanine(966)-N(2))-methyltransferase RsmD
MKIKGGRLKGLSIKGTEKLQLRPTTDYAKEALFNILQHQIDVEGAEILDLCAGTGSITFEFISRGAAKVTSIDINAQALKIIQQNASAFGCLKQIETVKADITKWLPKNKEKQYDLVFCDLPFHHKEIAQIPSLVLPLLKQEGIFIAEHPENITFEHPKPVESRKYGAVCFSFFTLQNE